MTIANGVFETSARFFQTHDFAPPELPDGIRVVFTFANPLDSLLSFMKRRWERPSLLNCHCEDPDNANPFERDDLNFERMFDTWTAPGKPYPVLALRYESMVHHQQEIREYTGIESFVLRGWRQRSGWTADAEVMAQLRTTYASLIEKIERQPDIQLIT
jgi:hypothetical protein